MTYISNTTKSTQPVSWGMNTKPKFPTLSSMQTANSTKPSMTTPAPATASSGISSVNKYALMGAPKIQMPTQQATGTTPAPTPAPTITRPAGQTQTGMLPFSGATPPTTNKGVLPPPTAKTTPFSGFVGGLMNAGKPNKTQEKYLKRLSDQATKGEEAAKEAKRISELYSKEIERVGKLGTGAVAGAKSTGTEPIGRGNAAIAAESASNRISALSAAQSAALQGTGQQLTANEQAISGLTNTVGAANTQAQLGISALGTGAGLIAPSPAQYGQTVFDPATGQYVGGNLDPQTQANNLAQQVLSGRMTYDQAIASLGYAGQAGTNFLNNALTQAGGNPLALQAQGAGQQANVSTQTTATTDIARQGLADTTQQYVQMNTAAEFAHAQANAVTNILAQTGLNNISSTDYNKALRNVQQRFSDVNRTSLQTALQEAQLAYANLLSTGGYTPSGNEAAALNSLNMDNSAAAINAAIVQLESAVARRLQAQYGAVQQYQQNLGGGGGMTGGGGGFAEVW